MSEYERLRDSHARADWGDVDEWEHEVESAEAYARRDHPAPVATVALRKLRVLAVELEDLRDLYSGETSEAEVERLKALRAAVRTLVTHAERSTRHHANVYREDVERLAALVGVDW